MKTINNFVMTELYKGKRKIQTKVSSGFASVQQKSNLVRLKVLADAVLQYGSETLHIEKDCVVILREEDLYTQKHLTKRYEMKDNHGEFMLIDLNYIIGIEE